MLAHIIEQGGECRELAADARGGERALANQIALEFSKRAEYMEHELSAGGPRVDLLGERGEADSARPEVVGQSDEVAEASAQTVQPPHNQRIAFAQRAPHRSADTWRASGHLA